MCKCMNIIVLWTPVIYHVRTDVMYYIDPGTVTQHSGAEKIIGKGFGVHIH